MSTTNAQVTAFNRLPRNNKAPSGLVPNKWHFDLRYISLVPPSHLLFLIQPNSDYVHMEPLPLPTIIPPKSALEFFPETAEQAAPDIASALLHSFLTSFGKFQNPPPPAYAPWELSTDDAELAHAVGRELQRIGVIPERCKIKISTKQVLKTADEAFDRLYQSLKVSTGITGTAAAVLKTPDSISFAKFRNVIYWPNSKDDDEETRVLQYTNTLSNATFSKAEASQATNKMMVLFEVAMQQLHKRNAESVRAAADGGDFASAIEYALRIQFGIGIAKRDRQLSRSYLVKAVLNPQATDTSKSIAHALLLDWYHSSDPDGSIRARYLHAAAYHADQSAFLSKCAGGAAPLVLIFGFTMERLSKQAPELLVQYKSLWDAIKHRQAEIAAQDKKAQEKRRKEPSRYRCANVGCQIMADKGSGKCDVDKKPSYCGTTCQREDWKNHKPFCKPNMPSSVIDDGSDDILGKGTKAGVRGIPVNNPDGSRTVFTSSTMSADEMKEFKDGIETDRRNTNANEVGLEHPFSRLSVNVGER